MVGTDDRQHDGERIDQRRVRLASPQVARIEDGPVAQVSNIGNSATAHRRVATPDHDPTPCRGAGRRSMGSESRMIRCRFKR
jgi:hypothetical protein